jgi:Integrase core domain
LTLKKEATKPAAVNVLAAGPLDAFVERYNEVRPHSSLGYLTPAEYKGKHLADPMDGGRSPAVPARAGQKNNARQTVDAMRRVSCERL